MSFRDATESVLSHVFSSVDSQNNSNTTNYNNNNNNDNSNSNTNTNTNAINADVSGSLSSWGSLGVAEKCISVVLMLVTNAREHSEARYKSVKKSNAGQQHFVGNNAKLSE